MARQVMGTAAIVAWGIILIAVGAIAVGGAEIGPQGRLVLLVSGMAATCVAVIAVVLWHTAVQEQKWVKDFTADVERL